MQLSAPIHAQSSPNESAGTPENAKLDGVFGDSALWGRRAQKKSKPGIFAKLLEGLVTKNKGEARQKDGVLIPAGDKNIAGFENIAAFGNAGGGESAHGVENAQSNENAADSAFLSSKKAKTSLFAGQNSGKTQLFGSEAENVNENPIADEFGFPDTEFSLDSDAFYIESGDFRGVRKGKEAFRFTEDASGAANLPGDDVMGPPAGEEAGGFFPEAAVIRDEKKGSQNGSFTGGERRKLAAKEDFHALLSTNPDGGSSGVEEAVFLNARKAENSENENPRSQELRLRRGKERPNVEIRDLRTAEGGESGAPEVSRGQFINLLRPDSAVETEITVTLDGFNETGEPLAEGKSGPEQSRGRFFEDALAREIRGNLSADIVRDAALIIRNGSEGTIRLSLRPDSLGNVKIRLEMTENKITGHIIVESNEALRAFERELPVLEKAFRDSGFSETNLEMSLAQDGGNFGGQEQRRDAELPGFAPVFAAARYEAGTDWVNPSSDAASAPGRTALSASPGRKAVNLLV